MSQEIVFTTLPHQRTTIDGTPFLKLSVFATIRLKPPKETTLAQFEELLAWPEKILNARYKFRLGDGTELEAQLLKDKIDPQLFRNIFLPEIRVKAFEQENLTAKRIYSFPVQHIRDFVLQNYRQVAVESPTRLVSADKFVDLSRFGSVSRVQLNEQVINRAETRQLRQPLKIASLTLKDESSDRQLRTVLQRDKFQRFSPQMNPKQDFTQLRQFHRLDAKIKTGARLQLKKPQFEFHDILSVVSSYPQMMRKLGFVLDFLIPYQPAIPANGTILLLPSSIEFSEPETTLSVPPTAYQLTPAGFYAADRNNSIFRQGFVKINTPGFSVVQVDADGAALKTHNMTENKVQEVAKFYQIRSEIAVSRNLQTKTIEEAEPPADEGLPTMRSAGIAVIKNGMAEHLFSRFAANQQLQPNLIDNARLVAPLKLRIPDFSLYSDDLVQAYRMDIAYEDNPSKWYSLHHRRDEYTWFDAQNTPHPVEGTDPDEGYIELGIAEDPDDPDDVFVSETLARWEGWSLAVGKPGYAINEADDYKLQAGETVKRDFVNTSKTAERKKYTFDPTLEFKVNAQSKIVPGTLPRLRFGKDYRVRIRTVDLAGNSAAPEQQSETPAETLRTNIRYLRYEPLSSPILLAGNRLKDGEFPERMVIRSNFDRSAKDYESSYPVEGEKFDDFAQRYLLPPKNSQAMAETHGMFEKAFGNNPAAAQEIYNLITSHEGLYQPASNNQEKIYQPSEVEIIYLPDPMAAGVALFVAEGYDYSHTQEFKPRMFSFFSNQELSPEQTNDKIPEAWYQARPLRIRLEEGDLNTSWNSTERIFTLFLPKGLRTRIKFSTFWREQDFKQLSAIWQMIKEENPGNLAELDKLARAGQHWMLSPSREMELVHAVLQPVEAPEIKALLPDRDFGQTFVKINTRFKVHGESTEKAEFQARWTEPVDDAISVKIGEQQGRNAIPDIDIQYPDEVITRGTIPEPKQIPPHFQLKGPLKLQAIPVQQFQPRTKVEFERDPQPESARVNRSYQVQSVRFREMEQARLSAPKTLVNRVKFDIEASRFSFLKKINLRLLPLEHSFGDTKHRWVDYKLVAASRYRDYFSKILKNYPELTTVRESEWWEKVNILSSARPKMPQPDYVIPTFEWRKTQSADAVRHQRLGGGLRIFLKRPWFSSGADEMLAVVLPPQPSSARFALMATQPGYTDYYTHWGIDPLLFSVPPENLSPRPEDFRLNPVTDENLQYPDLENGRANIVAYPVNFDEERQMWFCDLAIDPKTMYFPFVKLTLARYQPYSVKKEGADVCLSPVVFAPMMQLVPERQTTLRFKSDDQNSRFTLTVEGTIYNERQATWGNYSFLRISFLDSRIAQPIFGVIDDGVNEKKLTDEGTEIKITQANVTNNRFSVSKEFRLPREYKTAPFQVIIEEYERGPVKIPLAGQYRELLEQSEETDRLIYADVFKINEVEK